MGEIRYKIDNHVLMGLENKAREKLLEYHQELAKLAQARLAYVRGELARKCMYKGVYCTATFRGGVSYRVIYDRLDVDILTGEVNVAMRPIGCKNKPKKQEWKIDYFDLVNFAI